MRRAGVVITTAAAMLFGATARADEKPYSPYETATVHRVLDERGGAIELTPQGKTIEAIDVVTLDVIEDRDPAPRFLNWFHATSRHDIIAREVLSRVGDAWQQSRIDETARNLRDIRQVSVVLCVPLQGSAPDRVRLLVITKDIWSLRLNSDIQFASGKLQYLSLQPSEENLFGIHHTVNLNFALDPGTYSIGARYAIPRLFGSRIEAEASANVILNRETGTAEGSFGNLLYGQPLYATDVEWAWGAQISWRNEITRRYVGGNLAGFDSPSTPDKDRIPYQYKSDTLSGSYQLTRSFGRDIKHDILLGASASRGVYRGFELDAFDPRAVADFRATLPVSDTAIGPFAEYHTYATDFLTVLEMNTLGLQEDYRLGHDAYVKVQPLLTALGSTRNFVSVHAGAQYTTSVGKDGILRLAAEPRVDVTSSDVPSSALRLAARFVTPRLGFGRFVLDGVMLNQFTDYLNQRVVLGGDTRLRGYPSKAFLGKNSVVYNVEYRTRALEIWSCQLGAVAFYDVGDAFDEPSRMQLKHSVGAGLRVLFPQLDRVVMRFDWGVPLDPEFAANKKSLPGDFVVTFRQAFAMPGVSP
jgi:hypothetical protein